MRLNLLSSLAFLIIFTCGQGNAGSLEESQRFDILGVKAGMSREEALNILRDRYPNLTITSSYEYDLRARNEALRKPAIHSEFICENGANNVGLCSASREIWLTYSLHGEKVIAMFRSQSIRSDESLDFEKVKSALFEKYGKPHKKVELASGGLYRGHWSFRPNGWVWRPSHSDQYEMCYSFKARGDIKILDRSCGFSFRAFFSQSGAYSVEFFDNAAAIEDVKLENNLLNSQEELAGKRKKEVEVSPLF